MKGLIWLTVISVVVVWAAYAGLGLKLGEDPGQMIGYACGNPMNNKIQVQIVIAMGMTRKDPPKSEGTKQGLYVDWENWIADHFILRSEGGETIELQRQHFGNLIPSAKVGTPDSYLVGFINPEKPTHLTTARFWQRENIIDTHSLRRKAVFNTRGQCLPWWRITLNRFRNDCNKWKVIRRVRPSNPLCASVWAVYVLNPTR